MKAFSMRSHCVTVLLLCVSVAIVAASAKIEDTPARKLRVAVVDARIAATDKAKATRELAATLGSALEDECGGRIDVRAEPVSAANARARLEDGGCDAVLLVGLTGPLAMRRIEAVTLLGALDDARQQPVFFIVRDGDANLQATLAEAFSRLLTRPEFREAASQPVASLRGAPRNLAAIGR